MQSKLTPAPDVTSAGDSSVAQAAVGQSPLDVADLERRALRRRILAAAFDFCCWAVAMPLAAILRFDMDPPAAEFRWSIQLGLVMGIYQLVAGWLLQLYRGRYVVGTFEEVRGVVATGLLVGGSITVATFIGGGAVPRSLPIIATGLALFAMLTARFALRAYRERRRTPKGGRPTIVVGAGDVGQSLLRAIRLDPKSGYKPVALLDDNPTKQRLVIQGVPVRGTSLDLATVAEATGAEMVLLGVTNMPSATLARLEDESRALGLTMRVLPSTREIVEKGVDTRILASGSVSLGDVSDFLPFAVPDVGDDEVEAVAKAVKSGWLTSGPSMRAFESEFSEFLGGQVHTVAINSATAGLHLALEAFGVGPGDEVIVPTWTFTSTAEVVRYLGAKPVIVDVDPDTLNIDVAAVERALSPATRAVIPVHMAGLPADTAGIAELLSGTSVQILEDAAHTLPARDQYGLVGSCQHSAAAVFSFYATKPMTTGEGGMISTRNDLIADRTRVMRLHGIDRDAFDRYGSDRPSWYYDIVAPGFKYNMPDPAAALGRVQLARAWEMHARREAIAMRYLEAFADLPVKLPAAAPDGQVHSWHIFVLRLDDSAPVSRDEFVHGLSGVGVGTSVHFIPLHLHTYWRDFAPDAESVLPVASREFPRVVSLPIFSKMTDAQVDKVIDSVRELLT